MFSLVMTVRSEHTAAYSLPQTITHHDTLELHQSTWILLEGRGKKQPN